MADFAGSATIHRTGQASITIHDSHPVEVDQEIVADYAVNQLRFGVELTAEVAVTRPAGFRLLSGS